MSAIQAETTFQGLPDAEMLLSMALGVVVERIRPLDDDDRRDLFELLQALGESFDDPDESAACLRAVREILARRPVAASPMPQPEEEGGLVPGLHRRARVVAERLRSRRRRAGLTQAELAARAGLTQSHVSRLEKAEHSATRKTLARLAAALDADVSDLDPASD